MSTSLVLYPFAYPFLTHFCLHTNTLSTGPLRARTPKPTANHNHQPSIHNNDALGLTSNPPSRNLPANFGHHPFIENPNPTSVPFACESLCFCHAELIFLLLETQEIRCSVSSPKAKETKQREGQIFIVAMDCRDRHQLSDNTALCQLLWPLV